MINMTDGSHVYVGFGSFKFFFSHYLSSLKIFCLELITGFEPVTSSLPRKCSTDWAIWAFLSLEHWIQDKNECLKINKPRPKTPFAFILNSENKCNKIIVILLWNYFTTWWRGQDSNLRSRSGWFTVSWVWPLPNPSYREEYSLATNERCQSKEPK